MFERQINLKAKRRINSTLMLEFVKICQNLVLMLEFVRICQNFAEICADFGILHKAVVILESCEIVKSEI
jgi:hypothetical protein